ncbi:hypothetical protein Tco_0422912 [Tanacetum coccineum]
MQKVRKSVGNSLVFIGKLEEDDFDAGFDVVRDEGITHVEGDVEQVVIAAAKVVNAGVFVSTAKPKTPPTTATTTTFLEDDEVTVAATLKQMSETSKEKSIIFEDVEESAKEQREGKALMVEEDDIIRANVESNAELSKILLGENEPGEDFATRMVNLLNQRKKFFAEQRAQARRNRPMTQTQQRTYMSTYLKHQGSWTFAQLKKLSDEEIKAKYERLVKSIANFVPMGAEERVKRPGPELQSDTSKKQKTTEVKEVPVIEEPVKEPTAPKQEEIEQPIKKSGRQKSMARKRKLGQSTAKEDEEYEKEKEELSLFFIIAFDEHKEVDYDIFDQRSPIIAWNSKYYGPKSLLDEVEVLKEINMNVGDLTTMFHPNEEDDLWKSQEKWNIMSWKLHKSSGIHTLKTDTEMVIYMLVEKKYPLMKKVLLQMLELKLESKDDKFKESMQNYTRFDAQSFKDAMICNMDSIGKYMLEIILHQQRTPHLLKQKKLMQTQEDHSNPIQALNIDSLKVDLVVIQNTCSEKEDTNSETASSKSVKESSLMHAIKYKMSKAKERCMSYFQSLHSHLQVLSKQDFIKATRNSNMIQTGHSCHYFGQDVDTSIVQCSQRRSTTKVLDKG